MNQQIALSRILFGLTSVLMLAGGASAQQIGTPLSPTEPSRDGAGEYVPGEIIIGLRGADAKALEEVEGLLSGTVTRRLSLRPGRRVMPIRAGPIVPRAGSGTPLRSWRS